MAHRSGSSGRSETFIVSSRGMPAAPVRAGRLLRKSAEADGRGRRYRPLNLNTVSQEELDEIAHRLNSRPRKTLGFMTPSRKLSEVLQ